MHSSAALFYNGQFSFQLGSDTCDERALSLTQRDEQETDVQKGEVI